MLTAKGKYGLGWIPDYPDFRDYTEGTEEVKSVLGPTGALKAKKLPASVDLREHCSPVAEVLWAAPRCLPTVSLQDRTQSHEGEGGYGGVSPDDHGGHGPIWSPAGGILAVYG